MRRHPWLLALTVLVAVLGGCSGDDDSAERPEKEQPSGAPSESASGDFVEIAVLDSRSPYVQELCSIDFFDPEDPKDPMGWLVGELRQLPTDSAVEAQEVEWMIERVERSEDLDDPLESDDLSSVAAILRARCSP